ncbi:hypothetical protein CDD82_7930 [Ophiocordyceps australis]|uniref:Zn(2)-C6 fungal-type domain-containing protein n=1 Tax=Ophiocordyceps australis TaxID=1399860 RepID=A0A2C5ZPK5_9HYPO|nr:hypothetical protein CDD82_7930 [Ophiocordyceps australis]
MQRAMSASPGKMSSSGPVIRSKEARFPTKFRLQHARSRTGCLVCRKRKKKCDERRPHCNGCTRNRLDCTWPRPSHDDSHPGYNTSQRAIVPSSPWRQLYATTFTPVSPRLLEHYQTNTALHLQVRTCMRNPFVTCVLSLAQSDNVLMHAVLAVSGAHLSYKLPDAAETELATRRHYLRALNGLQHVIASGRVEENRDMQSLLLTLAFLCQYEVLSTASSSIFAMHLSAMRHILARLCQWQVDDTDEALSCAYEGYCFLALSNTIIPSTRPSGIYDLGLQRLRPLTKSPNFGIVFAGGHDLFALIPQAQQLYCRRLDEEASGLARPSPELMASHAQLSRCIETWSMEPAQREAATDLESDERTRLTTAAECIRSGLRIYALASIAGPTATSATQDAHSRQSMRQMAEALLDMVLLLAGSRQTSHLGWAIVIAGTCLETESSRSHLSHVLLGSQYQMAHLVVVEQILNLLWRDADPRAYGPYGLQLVMEKHGLSLCIM